MRYKSNKKRIKQIKTTLKEQYSYLKGLERKDMISKNGMIILDTVEDLMIELGFENILR